MEEDYVKEAHDSFRLFDFLATKKRYNSAVIVITPNQLINCKTTGDGKGNHAPMFSYIADRILPGKIVEFLRSRDDVCEENELIIAGKILDEDCIKCRMSSERYGSVLGWTFPKSGKINVAQFKLLERFLTDNRDTIERTGTKMGIIGEGDAITIDEFIKRAKEVVDLKKEIPKLYADEEIIGVVPEIDDKTKTENEQK